jgi:NAD(P)-dependent dehydrogenase (short-subunit alcohol dehydrogenase family)
MSAAHPPNPTEAAAKVVLVTGASSGFGALTARALAAAGHSVHAGMRATTGHNAAAAQAAAEYGATTAGELHAVDMDVTDQDSVDRAVAHVLQRAGHLDVVVHNAGHMVLGPTEAFTPDQLAATYDVNTISTQRVNRAVLPHMRSRRQGLLVWIGSSSTRGGTPPYLAPYFAAKAGMDSLAVSYAAELARFGIDTSIIVPGAFTVGTNHFANAGHPADQIVASAYEELYEGLPAQIGQGLAALADDDQDPADVARAVVRVVNAPCGKRPFRVHIDPAHDGAEVANAVGDRLRTEFYRRLGLEDLLTAQ